MENSYDQLMAAADSLCDLGLFDVEDWEGVPNDRMDAFLAANRQALATAHNALARPCFAPLE